jgi:CHAD domain-containing protein
MMSVRAKPVSTRQSDLAKMFDQQHGRLQLAAARVARNPSVEAVHAARVAARRLRALLDALGDLEERPEVRRYEHDLRAVALELAAVRQADVLREVMEATLANPEETDVSAKYSLMALLSRNCVVARRQLRAHTRSLAWSERLERLERSRTEVQRLLGRIRDQQIAARDMIVNSAHAFWRARRHAGRDAERLHRLRIRAKAHRYVVESLAPFMGLDARHFSTAARGVQQGIGYYLDARIARKWLQTHAGKLDKPLVKRTSRRLRSEGRKALKDAKLGLRSLSR